MNNQKNDYGTFMNYVGAMPTATRILVVGRENIAAVGQQAFAATTQVDAPRLSQLAAGFNEIVQADRAPLALVAAANEVAKVVSMASRKTSAPSRKPGGFTPS